VEHAGTTDEPFRFPPGSGLPDVTLPDQDGIARRLSDLPGGDPLVLHTYRGWFCPKERTFFRTVMLPLQEVAEVGYIRMVSVSVEPPEVSAALRAGLDARWTFLSDVDRGWQQQLDLLEVTDLVHRPYLPTVIVCDPDLTVRASWNGYWMWGRPTLHDLWTALRDSGEALRPDWIPPRG
jgi:peroxiredoxin